MFYSELIRAKAAKSLSCLLSFAFCTNLLQAEDQGEDELLQAALQPRGSLIVLDSNREIGEVTQGSAIIVKFPYRVEGKGPVKILGLHEDCGCLSTSLKPGQYLQVGEQGEISVSLDTKAFVGPVDKTILVLTDEARTRGLERLRIRGKIKQMVALSPPLVRFAFSKGKDRPEALVAVNRLSGQTLNIEKVEFNKDNLDVNVEPVRENWQVRIKWKGDVPVKPFQEMIRISAAPPYGNLQIPVLGHVEK